MGNSSSSSVCDIGLQSNVAQDGNQGYFGCYNQRGGLLVNTNIQCFCSGIDCEYWFPPRDSGYLPTPLGTLGKQGCISFDQNNIDKIDIVTNICITGNPTFTYNSYKPVPYTYPPTVMNGTYIPPQEKIPSSAYYNYGLFSNPIIEIPLSINPGPSSIITEDNSNPTCTQQFNYNLNNTPESYAIFSVTYTISEDDFSDGNLPNQILDFFYLYETLSNTFTNDFKNSCYYNDTKTNLAQMVMDYCSNSGNMNFSLCSTDFLPFSFLNQSPCIGNMGYCKKGFLNYCSDPSNYNNKECLQYYSQSYNGTQLDTDTQVMLQDTCSTIYNSTQDKSTLDQSFWTVCGCFLPKDVYNQYLEKNNMDETITGYPQCWYVPCITSSVLPSTKPQCPTNDITNCIQYKYITLTDTDTNQTQTKVMENSLSDCSSIHYDYITTKEGQEQENFELFQVKKNKKLNIIFIVLICIVVIMILIKKFFI